MSEKDVPNFAAWNLDTLAAFAKDAYLKLQAQQEQIEQQQRDLKTALAAYRRATVQGDDWK